MNIIVVGCGKIGRATISSLVSEGHDVTAIDNDESVLTEISNIYDVMSICANGAECESLKEANVSDCDLFIAVTGSDESNMLTTTILTQVIPAIDKEIKAVNNATQAWASQR